jgi:glutaconate CoA-transferase, subunit A
MFQWGLKAAAFGLPFLPTRVGLGTDLAALGGLKTVTSPYADGETLIAMPALKLDAALLHVNRSDWRGNIQAFGPDTYYDEWFAKAAARCFVTAEEVVERCFISGVVHAPGGAHPSSMPPLYGWDSKWLKTYTGAVDAGWPAFHAEHTGASEADYMAKVGGLDAISSLPLPVF